MAGTLPYKAPELFNHPPILSKAADVYAYSILAWCVVTGEQPFANMAIASTEFDEQKKAILSSS